MYIFIIVIFIYGCESNTNGYEIIKREKTISKNNCRIKILFPEISGLEGQRKLAEINKVLENFPKHEYYAHDCLEKKRKQNEVTGDYEILLENDTILSIEFRTYIQRTDERAHIIYHSVVINPKQAYDSKIGIVGIDPKQIFPTFKRGMIYPYIKKYSIKHKKHINLLAYETGSNYIITWAITKTDLIVYPGGEGEWYGDDKVKIPLEKLK